MTITCECSDRECWEPVTATLEQQQMLRTQRLTLISKRCKSTAIDLAEVEDEGEDFYAIRVHDGD